MTNGDRCLQFAMVLSWGMLGWACQGGQVKGVRQCELSAECPAGHGCAAGYCRSECVTSQQCQAQDECVSGYCMRPCKETKDCKSGEECQNWHCGRPKGKDGGDGSDDRTMCSDLDGDGYGADCGPGPDCDDMNAAIHPDGTENCQDGIDNDCDGRTDSADWDCGCKYGQTRECYSGPGGTLGFGVCRPGISSCGANSMFGGCQGERLPSEDQELSCDELDNDCDGMTDEGLLNACGQCGVVPAEVCGDGLDNNCDGNVDEKCDCDPNCHCAEPGAGGNCRCQLPTHQACYSGVPATSGIGLCHGGYHDCVRQANGDYRWGPCEGGVVPATDCDRGAADGLDNDCDGAVDEDCLRDQDGDGYSPPSDCNDGNPAIHPGAEESCNGEDDNCNGLFDEGVANACALCGEVPQEKCGDGIDNNCSGQVDEICGGCNGAISNPCYRGPEGTVGIGLCHWGTMTCDGEFWSECSGDIVPAAEICDGFDNDCDGLTDERWAVGSNACGLCNGEEGCDGVDNDCDGLTDEGLRNGCGRCLPVPEETACDGLDNDCDGLTDEGLLTVCGKCPDGAPCYQEDWNKPGECNEVGRTCDGVVADDANPVAITLGQGTVHTPFIYIAVYERNQVAKLDTETGEKIWQVSSWGTAPSRTAVAMDYSVWVGNRGFASPNDPNYSNAAHLDADGNLICRADVTGIARGVAIDGEGNAWIGAYNTGILYKVSGTEVDTTQTPPRCQILATVNTGVNIYGLAIDGNGFLWTASAPTTAKVNTLTNTLVDTVPNPGYYGIAIDRDNNVWFGGWSNGGPVHRIQGTPPYTRFDTAVSNVTAVTVARDGYVWGSSYGTNEVVKIDPNTGAAVCRQAVQHGSNPHGIAVDANGKVWVPKYYGGNADRFLSDCTPDGSFVVDAGQLLYTYSDMTGMQLRTITTREGHWIQTFDSGYQSPTWHEALWVAAAPPATSVALRFVAADSEAELQTNPSPICGPFAVAPANLLSCAGVQGHRWLSVDVQLITTQDGIRPTLSALQVSWSH